MKPLFILVHVLIVLSRIETNEATRTHLLLPSLQTRAPVKTPTPNPGTEASVNMATKLTERNFAGRKEVFVPPTNAYQLHEPLLLPSLQTRAPVKTPSPNPGTEASVNMATKLTERNFVGRKEVFVPPTNAYQLHEPLLLPSLQTRAPVKTPTPNPGTEASVNMATKLTERNFAGRKEVFVPRTNAYQLHEPLLLPSLQTRTPVKTPSPNPGTGNSVNMASKVTERNFVGRKEVFVPSTNAYQLHEPLLLPSLQTRAPVKTPSPNPGTGNSVNMASKVTERNFAGRKEVFVPSTNAYHLHEPLLLPSLQTRAPVNTPSPKPGTGNSVNMATKVTERNLAGRKEVVFAPPNNAYSQNNALFDVSIATTQK